MRSWRLLFPDDVPLVCEQTTYTTDGLMVHVRSTAPVGICPRCQGSSASVHSHYQRTLADLPWQGQRVILKLTVRKFFCRQAACAQRVFTERLPQLAAQYARQTTRLMQFLQQVGVVAGGQSGARLAQRSGIRISPSSLLRLIRRLPIADYPAPSIIGVDEWSYRRGRRYGTILCDLERQRPIDLLPERSAALLAQWLQDHPGIHTISRDRGHEFIRGANLGAPQAIQVADRFHLLQNLRDVIVRVMDRHRPQVRSAARRTPCPVSAQAPVSALTPYLAYLQKRWQQGCRQGKVLHQELQAQGFQGSVHTVYHFLEPWRYAWKNDLPIPPPELPTPSSKLVAAWVLKHAHQRQPYEQAFLDQLTKKNGELKGIIQLASQFIQLLRHRQVSALPQWLREVEEVPLQKELKRYAKGLREDLAAVGAAVALPWSNGQVEGQINRLKLIKRQMYGRANFDLLRCRFLAAA